MVTVSKNFASGLLGVIENDATLISTDSWTHESWLLDKQYHILDIDSEHKQPSGEAYPRATKYCHLAGIVTEFSKGHFTILCRQMLQDSREHGNASEFHEDGTIATPSPVKGIP